MVLNYYLYNNGWLKQHKSFSPKICSKLKHFSWSYEELNLGLFLADFGIMKRAIIFLQLIINLTKLPVQTFKNYATLSFE